MKYLILIFLFTTSAFIASAQSSLYTDGTTINTKFKITDIDTATHDVDSLVKAGKNIIILFFAANDKLHCWSYNHSQVLEHYYEMYGPLGTKGYTTEIFMLNEDPSSSPSDIVSGGWTTGNTFHIGNDSSMTVMTHFIDMSAQPIAVQMPTVVTICANNKEMFSIPTTITDTTQLYQQILGDCFPVAIHDKTKATLAYKLIPNPADVVSILQVNMPGTSIAKYTVTNVAGQIIYKSTKQLNAGINNLSIPTDNWNNGLYFIHLQAGEITVDTRLVVQH